MENDGLKEAQSAALMSKIIGGLLLPIGFIWYGIYIFTDPTVTLIGRHEQLILRGANAVFLGLYWF